MKATKQQTAVEWLVEKLKSRKLLIGDPDNLIAVGEAKEMEKRMYSEEEVLELLLNRPGPYLTDEEIKEWFEQFKKK